MKWGAGVALVGLLVGCTSEPPAPPLAKTVTVTQTASPKPTKEPTPPSPDPVLGPGISCGPGSQAVDPQGLLIGFRLWIVTRVVNGDTVEAKPCDGGREIDVQFIGIDTPEPVGCYGPEASAFTHRWLNRRLVRLDFDKDRIDPYGRTLAYVITEDGHLFNELLVRWGFATVATYPPNTKHVREFRRAERRAHEQGLGLWSVCGV